MEKVDEVKAVTGQGLEGDRYFYATGTFSPKSMARKEFYPGRNITLIEAEAIEGANAEDNVELDYGEPRRNVITRGIALNHLVDKEFSVGEVRLRGTKLCEPCGHLESLTRPGVKASLIHRGGLRAEILSDGVIRAGDSITA
jgi:MOSC domain-containing protein YiiM